MEVFANIRNFVFDKTGTLTTGNFRVKSIKYFAEGEAETDAAMLKMERHSSHPIAKSLVAYLEKKGAKPSPNVLKVKELKGHGISAEDSGGRVLRLGSQRYAAPEFVGEESATLFFAKQGQVLATVEIEDDLRPDAVPLMAKLRAEGRVPILLSGDRASKVADVANHLNISRFHAEQLPADKLTMVKKLAAAAPTAMVGDGINDAPALAAATIGVSLSHASQVAMQSAQIILLNGNLERLGTALDLSGATLRTIRQNLFWAFAYNLVAIPVAAFGFLNPTWGALFMAFSDVVVIGNSIRLKYRSFQKGGWLRDENARRPFPAGELAN
jgi:Cu+-exporting ATPase